MPKNAHNLSRSERTKRKNEAIARSKLEQVSNSAPISVQVQGAPVLNEFFISQVTRAQNESATMKMEMNAMQAKLTAAEQKIGEQSTQLTNQSITLASNAITSGIE